MVFLKTSFYFSKRHLNVHNGDHLKGIPSIEADDVEVGIMPVDSSKTTKKFVEENQDKEMPVIRNLFEWLQTTFETDEK